MLEQVLSLVEELNASAAFLSGPEIWYNCRNKFVFLISKGFPDILCEKLRFNEHDVTIVKVREGLLEDDIKYKLLGGFLIEHLISPYEPILNHQLLSSFEVQAKEKIIEELITDLSLEYADMASLLRIDARFFLYEYARRRGLIYPKLKFHYSSMLENDSKVESMMKGFKLALEELAKKSILFFDESFVRISEEFVQKALSNYKARAFLNPLNILALRLKYGRGIRTFAPTKKILSIIDDEIAYAKVGKEIKDPRSFLFTPTKTRLVSLKEEMVKKEEQPKGISQLATRKILGTDISRIANTSYQITYVQNGKSIQVIVKNFKNWTNLKWLLISLYVTGVQKFTILGERRMAREFVFINFLREKGFNVPTILHVDWSKKLLFEEFIRGRLISEIVCELASSDSLSEEDAKLAERIGAMLAEIHSLGITLGDFKPSNVLLTPMNDLYIIDLEQAKKGGNPTWDIAEFVYFLPHYAIFPREAIFDFASKFLEGYIKSGGSPKFVALAGAPRYMRLFGLLALPSSISRIAKVCREVTISA